MGKKVYDGATVYTESQMEQMERGGQDLSVTDLDTVPVLTPTTPIVGQGASKMQTAGGVGTPAEGTEADTSGTVTENGQVNQVTNSAQNNTPQKTYLADWGKDGLGAFSNGEFSIQDGIRDYGQWAQDNGQQPLDYLTLVSLIQNKDITKSSKENEKTKRNQELQEKWERTGNLLAHLGNFVGASVFGAPDQKHEDIVELKGRQKKISDAIEAKRDAYNQNYLKAYQMDVERRNKEAQQKVKNQQEAEELKLKQQKAQATEDYQKAQIEIRRAEQELKKAIQEKKDEREVEKLKAQKEYWEKMSDAAFLRAQNGGRATGTTTTYTRDDDGNVTSKTVTKGAGSGGAQQKTAGDGGGKSSPAQQKRKGASPAQQRRNGGK